MFARHRLVALATTAVLATFCGAVQAETILVDFNSTASTPTLGGTWNTIDAPSATAQRLYDTSGNLTSMTLATTGSFQDSSGVRAGWSRSWVDSAATYDYFYLHGTNVSGTVTFAGLDDSRLYNVNVIASRPGSETQGTDIADITVQGLYANSEVSSDDFDCYNSGYVGQKILIWEHVAPSNNQIELSLQTQDSGYVFLNAVQLVTVPEPSTFLLLGLAAVMVCLCPCRRARS